MLYPLCKLLKTSLFALILIIPYYAFSQGEGSNEMMQKAAQKFADFRNNGQKKGDLDQSYMAFKEAMAQKNWKPEQKDRVLIADLLRQKILYSFGNKKELLQLSGEDIAQKTTEAFLNQLSANGQPSEERQAVLNNIQDLQSILFRMATQCFSWEEYADAYKNVGNVFTLHDMLKANTHPSILDQSQTSSQVYYVAAASAILSNQPKKGFLYAKKIYDLGLPDPATYDLLATSCIQMGDMQTAGKYLREGRIKFSEDPGLLYAEINFQMKTEQPDAALINLDIAISQNPEYPGNYVTKAEIYGQKYLNAEKAKPESGENYFNLSARLFEQAFFLQPENPAALFGAGTLYLNRAEMQQLKMNQESAGRKMSGTERDALSSDLKNSLEKSFSYLKSLESLNPNDTAAIKALYDFYTLKQDPLKSEFSRRLEILRQGGKLESSYFKKE